MTSYRMTFTFTFKYLQKKLQNVKIVTKAFRQQVLNCVLCFVNTRGLIGYIHTNTKHHFTLTYAHQFLGYLSKVHCM